MKDFFKSLVASFFALLLFFGVGAGLLIASLVSLAPSGPAVPKKAILVLDLNTNIPDSAQDPGPGETVQRALRGRMGDGAALPLLTRALDRAANDPDIAGLFLTGNLRVEGYGSGYGALVELREAIARFKKTSEKPVIAYNQGWGKREYFVSSVASTLYGNPFGHMEVMGPSAEMMFMAGAFKKYGIEFQVTRVGKYKSAVEPFVLEKMSEENRAQYQKLLDDLWTEWKGGVADARRKSPEDIQRVADEKGILTATEAQREGLVDKLAHYDEVLDELKRLTGKKETELHFPQIDLLDYAKVPSSSEGKNRIAVVVAEGEIVDGDGGIGQIGGDQVGRDLRELRLDPDVKAIVLRVNSPGGSATASDVIQREVVLAKRVKPVVVSMGTVAASGGYWISTYGDRIFAEPETITGSIGVFGMLANVQKLANEHGITFDSVKTAKLASPSLAHPSSPEEMARMQVVVDEIYDQFLQKVAEGRKMSKEAVHEIAQGRVWSGREAQRLGLVDEMGGLKDAIGHAAKLAKIEDDYRVDAPSAAPSPVERLLHLLEGKGGEKAAQAGLGDQLVMRFQQQLRHLNAFNDPQHVYARLPLDVVVK